MLDVKNEDREIVTRANNCEHFVNRAVLGLNFSELSTRRIRGWSSSEFSSGGTFDNSIRRQLNDNEVLSSLTYHAPYGTISDINRYKQQSVANSGQSEVMRDGIQMQAAIVTTPPN